MLNGCGIGVTVVNIDNGFGAACAADDILRLADAPPGGKSAPNDESPRIRKFRRDVLLGLVGLRGQVPGRVSLNFASRFPAKAASILALRSFKARPNPAASCATGSDTRSK
jgi:hypothetical protein